jgi:catechol 2,3-dioxygenase-like lactoylglutathione lyase family enzyme
MLGSSEVVAFAATVSPDRAKEFYGRVLGLPLIADEPWALVFDAYGTMLRVQKVQNLSPPPFTQLGWKVIDIARMVDTLRERGVTFERYGFLSQDERGIWKAPDGARVAWFKDPDGNTLSLTQFA